MDDPSVLERLSTDGRERLVGVRDRLRPCFAQRRREPLRRWIEGAWLALGGPVCAEDATDLEDAAIFLGLLDELEEGGDLPDFSALEERVARLYALPDPDAGDRLQIMTIHKAKGLEFDTVILPGLGYAPRPNESQLLLWLERPRLHRGADLLLAPIRERSESIDPIYRYLASLDSERGRHEDGRLLYVAATRAKSRLHLVGHCEIRDDEARPRAPSLLSHLWPVVGVEFERALAETAFHDAVEHAPRVAPATAIFRLPAAWSPPSPRRGSIKTSVWGEARGLLEEVEFSWASETAKHIGSVVHRWLQTIAEEGVEHWPVARLASFQAVLTHDLRVLGVPETELARALTRVIDALGSALDDQRARWVLSKHAEAQSELRLTGVIDAQVVNIIVDRTFIDERGVRWIVDYKTGLHEGADLEGFLDNERERYRDQLERYATLLARLDSRPIRLALYFPLLKGWREWEIEKQSRLI
jgi:ATP-dependent exoDNAse (exonuclease V) beta subunit